MQIIINAPHPQPVRWLLKHPTHGYLADNGFRADPHGCYYFDGEALSAEEDIKETFEGLTDLPLDQFDCIGIYEPDGGYSWD